MLRRSRLGVLAWLWVASIGWAAKMPGESIFRDSKVVQVRLTIDAKEFDSLTPKGGAGFGGFGGFGPPRKPTDNTHRNTFGVELPWAKGEIVFADKTYSKVGIRYKGNFTYTAAQRALKKSWKLDFDKFVDGQKLDGLSKLNLHSGVTDPTLTRETLSYSYFRMAGVPAPRTALAELFLTVPGKYDNEYVGVYTLVEQVNKTFLKSHFKDGKGLLLKPEGLQGGLTYFGADWKTYEERYQPKNEPTPKQKQRLIEFTRFLHQSSDDEFAKKIESYLDVEAFLRFLAANALLSNLDSYLGFGHNYYLYLIPSTNKFVFIPWDLDLSLATWPAAGTPEQLVQLSIRRPHAGENKLIDRLLAIENHRKRYLELIKEQLATCFTKEKLLSKLDEVEKALEAPRAKEKRAVAARREGGGSGGFGMPPFGGGQFGQSMPPRLFVEKRLASVEDQLAGKSKGYEPRTIGFGPPPGGGFGPPPGGFGGFGPPPRVGELMPGDVANRLKLTPAQRRKIAELQKEIDLRLQKILNDDQNEQWKRMREAPRPGGFGPGRGFGPPRRK